MTVRIPSPCHEDWSRMAPNERGRHCASCDKTVVDVTRMAPQAGANYLRRLPGELAAGAKVCVHAHADARGRLLSPVTRRLLTNGLATVLAMTIAGCNGHGPEVQNPQNQQQSQLQNQPQNQQPTQPSPQQMRTMGEPVAAMPGGVTCDPPPQVTTKGDVAVTPQS
ncbi:MAG: hypothetical protein H0W83_18135 [Planctomycetes bacterium]|nr:hypothetical protein [Planctomycetota bacterium]